MAFTALYFHHELKICTKAFQTAGLNQLKAEEALERAQHYIEELREWNVGLAQESFEQQLRIAELEESNGQLVQSRDHYKRMCEVGNALDGYPRC